MSLMVTFKLWTQVQNCQVAEALPILYNIWVKDSAPTIPKLFHPRAHVSTYQWAYSWTQLSLSKGCVGKSSSRPCNLVVAALPSVSSCFLLLSKALDYSFQELQADRISRYRQQTDVMRMMSLGTLGHVAMTACMTSLNLERPSAD